MIKTMIFDFDGTIADTLDLAMGAFKKLHIQFNFNNVNGSNIAILKSEGAKPFFKSLNIDSSMVKEIVEQVKQIEAEEIANTKMFPQISNVLKQLKANGVTLGILTSNSENNVRSFINKNKIDVFDFISSEDNLFEKATILKNIVSSKNLQPRETAYVGDEDRDSIAAKEAGLISIAVTWGYNYKQLLQTTNPDYLIDSPKELLLVQ